MEGMILVCSLLAAAFMLAGCTGAPDASQGVVAAPNDQGPLKNPPPVSDHGYDGTYDWYLGSVHGIVSHCSACVYIKNGQVSNSIGSFSNTRIDNFGNLVFEGPCPNGNTAIGTFSGKNGGQNPPQWQGTWSCADGSQGGPNSMWKIFNKH